MGRMFHVIIFSKHTSERRTLPNSLLKIHAIFPKRAMTIPLQCIVWKLKATVLYGCGHRTLRKTNGTKLTSKTPKHGYQLALVFNLFFHANVRCIGLITTTATTSRASTTQYSQRLAQPLAAVSHSLRLARIRSQHRGSL